MKRVVPGRTGVQLTVDYPGHSPKPQQDEETHPIKGIYVEDEDNVQDEGHQYHQSIEHLKLVLKKLQAKCIQLPYQLHHEEGEKGQAQVVEHLLKTKKKKI